MRSIPRVAVVSVGPNPYGHPVPEVSDGSCATGAEVLRTDRAGDVTDRFGAGGPRRLGGVSLEGDGRRRSAVLGGGRVPPAGGRPRDLGDAPAA